MLWMTAFIVWMTLPMVTMTMDTSLMTGNRGLRNIISNEFRRLVMT